jgi:hypothetical protein
MSAAQSQGPIRTHEKILGRPPQTKIHVASRTEQQADLKLLGNTPKGYRLKSSFRKRLFAISGRN